MRADKEVFYKIAYSDIEKINYKNVLDLCCGTLNSLKHINKSERYIGVDAVKEVIEIARKRYPNSETYISKIEDFNINEQFDLIVCFEAIGINRDPLKEGIKYTPDYIQKIFDKIISFQKPGSYLAINLGPQILNDHENFIKKIINTEYKILNFYHYGMWNQRYPYYIAKIISFFVYRFPLLTKNKKNKYFYYFLKKN